MKSEGQKQSQRHEKRLAKATGGSTTAASGAFWSRKGDVRTAAELIEHKWTGKLQFTLKSAVLKKITREAILDGRMPVLGIHLDGVDYVILLEDDFLDIRQERECPQTCTSGETTPSVPGLTPTSSIHRETKTFTGQ